MPRTSIRPAEPERENRYRLEDQVGFLLRRAYQRASGNLTERIGEHDLTPPQFATLARLWEHGKVSQNQLGRLVAMEPANIRDVVQRLKKRDLVATERDPMDARLILVSLTAKGLQLTEALLPINAACTAKTLAPLDPGERQLLFDFLRRIGAG